MGSRAVVLGGGVTPRVTPVHAERGGTYCLNIINDVKGKGCKGHWLTVHHYRRS